VSIDAAYTGQFVRNSDGQDYEVIDPAKVTFNGPEAGFGKKTKPTLARIARAGEEVVTNPGSIEESRVTAAGGEAIFINELPGGKRDEYIPRNNGIANGQQILNERYELIGGDINAEGAYFRPKGAPVQILHEAVIKPTVILDAWGKEQHQFLTNGATLKLQDGRITGIDKAAFDDTWSVTDAGGAKVVDAARSR
jgi:hypothetical protein